MNNKVFKFLNNSLVSWWIPFFIGIIFIIISGILFFYPFESYEYLSIAFSCSLLLAGIVELLYSRFGKKTEVQYWFFFSGIINIIAGALFIQNIDLVMMMLPYYFGLWLLFRSFLLFDINYESRRLKINNSKYFLILGLLTMIMAVVILFNPFIGKLSIVLLTTATFFGLGLFNIILSITIKNTIIHYNKKT